MRRLVAIALLLQATPARAYPFLALRPGGTPFEGATDGELSAVWWNPAALAQVRGLHFGGTGQVVLDSGSVARAPICSNTGVPGVCTAGGTQLTFPTAPFSGVSGSGFGGVSWDFRQENLTVAFAAFSPWESHRAFASGSGVGSTDSPTAYHLLSEDFSTVYYALALAFRLTTWLNAGVTVALADSSASMAFDRDAAVSGTGGSAFESSAQAQRIRVRGDSGTFLGIPSPTGLSFAIGTMVHLGDAVNLGLSFTHMFPLFGAARYSSTKGDGAELTPATSQNVACSPSCTGGDSIEYDIPDVWHLGVKYRIRPTVELESTARVVVYGSTLANGYQATSASRGLVVRLSGDPVTKAGAPERIIFAHSLTPTFAAEVGVRWRPKKWVRLGLSIAAETSAVPASYVDAEAMDAPKIDGMIGVELRPLHWLRVMLGYDVTGYVFGGSGTGSAFDPKLATQCASNHYALDSCTGALEGLGLPSAAGNYSLLTQRFNLGLTFDIQ